MSTDRNPNPDQWVSELLSVDGPEVSMPVDVVVRLDEVLDAESERRSSGEADRDLARRQAAHAKRNTTGSFGENALTKRHVGVLDSEAPTPSA